ncbi:MAG TPA: PssE/Cps14G family polysaccharide biosynthesis glycosyltransferase [Syntrophorhabdaceae bacterium]|nr:PssE/Cps14G family polysaccharide biosynthesis glycosyltransferase [Syntrophorhabdaceae bacterium]HOL06635.1 PssE/Cps14G family polysaccharide biosynthesis glycosyltransferase [Syntrophorhabdaceae bacterium]HQE81280.1 PssE/Cps14G family polysaccharide biosynthesis glycosyltransferase [Syntrophorhabdaceae bacterium]HQH44323.1 PssE/Cps14G family polysaccharide biosynthesis glycosyltransferase [Syntrophorhabdaceae bacterium]HRV23576.1 PssE/Cps14G family polysaccharide biosynthesis glycosyltrans
MIFVTVGVSIEGVDFERLINKIDEIAKELDEEIVAQIGHIKHRPNNIKWFRFMNFQDIIKYFKCASFIIGHCGTGTVLNALKFNKPIIVVPRKMQFNEHFDDHQLELADRLKDMRGVFVVNDIEELKETILKVKELLRKGELEPSFSQERDNLLRFLKDYVRDCRIQLEK